MLCGNQKTFYVKKTWKIQPNKNSVHTNSQCVVGGLQEYLSGMGQKFCQHQGEQDLQVPAESFQQNVDSHCLGGEVQDTMMRNWGQHWECGQEE